MIAKEREASTKLHIAYLFASPLMKKKNDAKQLMKINFEKEFKGVEDSLLHSNTLIKLRKELATKENLSKILMHEPLILHFSGHGFNIDKNTLDHKERILLKNKGNILVFENEVGLSDFIDEKTLKEVL